MCLLIVDISVRLRFFFFFCFNVFVCENVGEMNFHGKFFFFLECSKIIPPYKVN
jgi:hypothetical protein